MSLELVAELITRLDQLPDIEADWRRLWAAQARPEIFTSYDWSMAAMECRTDGARPHVAVVRRAGIVVGLLPLLVDHNGLGFLSGARSDYNDILVDDADAAAVIETALRCAMGPGGPGRGRLAEVPEWSQLARAIDGLPAALRSRLMVHDESTCPALRLGVDRDALLKEMTGKKSLKRHEKKLEKFGAVALRHIEDRGEVLQFLDDFFAQHITRRVVAGDRSLFLDDEPRRFYKALVTRLDPAKELRFAVLEAGGRAVAYHYGFEVAGRFTWYKPTFDVDYLDTGVGEVLLKRLLEYLKDRPIHEFDFTRGNESFKDRFSNHRGQNVQMFVHTTAAKTRVAGWLWSLKAQAKQTPWMANAHRWLRSRRGNVSAAVSSATRTPMIYRPSAQTVGKSGAEASTTIGIKPIALRALSELSAGLQSALTKSMLRDGVARVMAGSKAFLVTDGESTVGLGLVQATTPKAAAEPVAAAVAASAVDPVPAPATPAAASISVVYHATAAGDAGVPGLRAVLNSALAQANQSSATLLVDPADAGSVLAAAALGCTTVPPG